MIPASTASFSSAVKSSAEAVLPDLAELAVLLPVLFVLLVVFAAFPPQPDNKLTASVIQVNIDNNFFPFILLSFSLVYNF